MRVVGLLCDHGYHAPPLLAAAYLHDTLEDTKTTLPELVDAFGSEVAELVYWLSDLEKGNRKTRKMMSAWRLSRAPFDAKLIKLADLADNTETIVEKDTDFASVYLAEKKMILDAMAKVEGAAFADLALFKAAAGDAEVSLPRR